MKQLDVSLSLILLLVVLGCHRQPDRTQSGAQERLNRAALLLDSNSIELVKIAHEPGRIEHPFQVTLDALVSGGTAQLLEVRGPALNPHSHDLANALRKAEVAKASWSGDVNWAVVLYDSKGKEVVRIGFDESGRNGYVDSDAVHMSAGLLNWAQSVMPP